MAVHGGAQPRDRPAAPPADRRGEARAARRAASRVSDDVRSPCPTRLAEVGDERLSPAVHLLPSRARARGAGGADAPGGRRPDRRGDRARVPRARRDDVAAPGARQAQDPRRRDLVRAAGRRGAARPPRRRARGHLPDLQRGLRRHRGRGPAADRAVRRGAAPRQAAGDADARPAGGARAARADAVPRLAPRHPDRPRGRADPALRSGPLALGPGRDRGRGAGAEPRAPAPASRSLPARGGDRRAARRGRPPRRRSTGRRSRRCTSSCWCSSPRRWSR